MSKERTYRITTGGWDLRRHSIWRSLRQDVRSRFIPFGNFGGGPNLFFIARLLVLHVFGRLFVALFVRFGFLRAPLTRLARRLGVS